MEQDSYPQPLYTFYGLKTGVKMYLLAFFIDSYNVNSIFKSRNETTIRLILR